MNLTADMATERGNAAPANQPGANTATIAMGGGTPIKSDAEEFNISIFTRTAAAWASGGSLTGDTLEGLASGKNSQTLTAGLVFGGGGSPYSGLGVKTEEYDGTSFTAGGDLNTYRYTLGGAGLKLQV